MSIIRVVKDKSNPYVQIDRRIFEDERLKWRAKGILGYLLSRPDNWVIRVSDLVKRGIEGKDVCYSTLRELGEAGYICRIANRGNDGRFASYDYEVYESPDVERAHSWVVEVFGGQVIDRSASTEAAPMLLEASPADDSTTEIVSAVEPTATEDTTPSTTSVFTASANPESGSFASGFAELNNKKGSKKENNKKEKDISASADTTSTTRKTTPRKKSTEESREPTEHQKLFALMAEWCVGGTAALTASMSARVGKATKEALLTGTSEEWKQAADKFFLDAFWGKQRGKLAPNTLLDHLKPVLVRLKEQESSSLPSEATTSPLGEPNPTREAKIALQDALGGLQELTEILEAQDQLSKQNKLKNWQVAIAELPEVVITLQLSRAYRAKSVWERVLPLFDGFDVEKYLSERPYDGKRLPTQYDV